jgi:NADPH:quinone reductase-like Zn-dependent oxidoreductase/acyl carrier protein
MFAAAAVRASGSESVRVHDFIMHRALLRPEGDQEAQRWQVVARLSGSGECELELHQALPPDGHADTIWQLIAEARAASATADPAAVSSPPPAASEPVASAAIYSRFADLGVGFGPAFRLLTDVRRGDDYAEAWVTVPPGLEADAVLYAVHPVVLDSVLQLCSVAAGRGARDPVPADVLLPLGADRIQLRSGATGRLRARAWSRPAASGTSLEADVMLETADGVVVAVIEGMRFARAEPDAFAGGSAVEDSLYEVAWHRLPPGAPPAGTRADGDWLILCDRSGTADALVQELTARGGRCVRLLRDSACTRIAPDTWTIDPAMPDHFREVIRAGGWHSGAPLRGIVHLWDLDIPPFESGEAMAPGAADLAGPGSVLHLVQALVGAAVSATPMWIVTRGAQVVSGSESATSLVPRAAGVWGLAGVVAAEHPEFDPRVVDLDPLGTNQAPSLLQALLAPDGHRRIALRGGDRFAPRLERHRARPNTTGADLPLRALLARAGTLDGVEVRPVPRDALGSTDLRMRVLAAGVNFRDVLLALGMYPDAVVPLGAECAGVVTEAGAAAGEFRIGQQVFGFAPASLASEVVVPAAFVAPIPPGLEAEDAAAIPVAFLTALYGLDRLAGLRAGERVLIHAAAGGVGLAAVQLAQRRGAEIFATAGSDEKREFLRSLGLTHVLDSRSLAFADQVLSLTDGEGVHVVLNSLAGEFIPASLKALARGGRFVELGKRGILSPEEMRKARPDVTYAAFDLGAEAHADRALLRPMLDELCGALADGSLRPLPVTTYPLSQLQDAFRLMAQARHIGKIVLVPPAAAAAGSAGITGSGTYWITGGLGALGLETARWLVESGARHLMLTGRQAPSRDARDTIGALEALGAHVTVREADAADEDRMREVLAEIESGMPPLRGVFHAAGVVRDAVLVNQRWDDCAVVLRGKAHGAWVLHELTRHLPLDCFVMYSAAGVLAGAAGQGVYPAANAELDALAHARRRRGLPALSVAWGPWSGGGMATSMDEAAWRSRGFRMITRRTAFTGLATLLRNGATHAAVMPMDWVRFASQLPAGTDRQFYETLLPDGKAASQSPAGGPAAALVTRLRAVPSGQRREALIAHLRERTLHVLSLDAGTPIDPSAPLKDVGLDSLMSVELRNALTRSLGRSLPVTLLFDYPTLGGLAEYLARVLELEADAAPRARPADAGDAEAALVATLSEAEAEALLLEELERGTSGSHHG